MSDGPSAWPDPLELSPGKLAGIMREFINHHHSDARVTYRFLAAWLSSDVLPRVLEIDCDTGDPAVTKLIAAFRCGEIEAALEKLSLQSDELGRELQRERAVANGTVP